MAITPIYQVQPKTNVGEEQDVNVCFKSVVQCESISFVNPITIHECGSGIKIIQSFKAVDEIRITKTQFNMYR